MDYIANLPVSFWVTLGTVIITLILGQLTKKFTNLDKKKIPIQNLFIGLFVFVVQYLITKDVNIAVGVSGILSGGVYDILKSLMQLINKEDK